MSLYVTGVVTLLCLPTITEKEIVGRDGSSRKAWSVSFFVKDSKRLKGTDGSVEWISQTYNISQLVYSEGQINYYKTAKKWDQLVVSGVFDYWKPAGEDADVRSQITPYNIKIIPKVDNREEASTTAVPSTDGIDI